MALLTDLELAILTMKANGYNSNQISRRTDINPATVDDKLRRVYRKFDVHNIAQAVAIALVLRIIEPGAIDIPEHLTTTETS